MTRSITTSASYASPSARAALLAAWTLWGPSTPVHSQAQAPVPGPPTYQVLRQNEDWSYLRQRPASEAADPFDRIKYIPLSADGSVWLSLGGQVRERLEYWNHFNFGQPPSADHEDAFLLSRFLLHADLHVGEHMRAFVQGKSALITDRDLVGGRRLIDQDEADLQNAFLDLTTPALDGTATLRSGRQELQLGKQRLVSPLDWANTRRTFDGFSGILASGEWSFTAFLTRPVLVDRYDFNEADNHTKFFGLYATDKREGGKAGCDLYWLALEREDALFNGTAGDERRQTVGGRSWGTLGGPEVDYDLEVARQFGEVGAADIDATMFASQVGWKRPSARWTPRLYAGLDYATGDRRAGDDDVETFNQLFPLSHEYHGYIDFLGRQNLIDLNAGVTAKPSEKLSVDLKGHQFWRASDEDNLYGANGAATAGFPGSGSSSRDIGYEIDLTVRYQRDRHTLLQGGYSHFFAGGFVEDVSPGDDVDFLYLALQYTF